MNNQRNKLLGSALIAIAVLIADQLSKAAIVAYLVWGDIRTVIPGLFNIVFFKNRGAAFGFLGSGGSGANLRLLFLTVVSVVALVVLTLLIRRSDDRRNTVALSLIAGGAAGNLIDRAVHGSVVDFLDLHLGGLHWPAFNIADSAITAGVIIILYLSFFAPDRHNRR